MISIHIDSREAFDEAKNEFIVIKEQNLVMEHSLISISKWESKHHKSFLSTKDKNTDEVIDYIRCMTITPNVDPIVYRYLSDSEILKIHDYINDPMTATTFSGEKKTDRSIITAEIIYYWMITYNIPFECQKWHLNRLLTLINVCGIKNTPPKKMSKSAIRSRNASLNAARRKALGTRG